MLGRDPLIPPRRLLRYGRREFTETGDAWLCHLLALAGLRPGDRVLEVGSGLGSRARPLVRYLEGGSYEGLDTDRRAIGWCRRAYGRHAHFRFLQADLFHPRLNPRGAHGAAEYRLPYDEGSFDVVVATEAFAHLMEAEAAQLLGEVGRVLRPGGSLLAGFFVLDERSREAIAAGEATLAFLDPGGHVAVLSDDLPEEAVAYDAGWLAERAPGPIDVHPGRWRGAEQAPELLDLVAARRA